MGLIQTIRHAFTRKSTVSVIAPIQSAKESSLDAVLYDCFISGITKVFPDVIIQEQSNGLLLNPYAILLETRVSERTVHPNAIVLAVGVRLHHTQYFPNALVDCVVGIGENDLEAAQKGVRNIIASVLSVVIDALEGYHSSDLNITSADGEVMWHPVFSPVFTQGMWSQREEEIDENDWFLRLKEHLLERLLPQPLNWVKIYAIKMSEGNFIGECNLNNELWEAGLAEVRREAEGWKIPDGDFAGQKQFLVFRRCGLI